MNTKPPFVCAVNSGTPILLCPTDIADHWEGINEPSGGRIVEANFSYSAFNGIRTDYDRACDVANDYVNTIQIGPGQAFLFGDEIPTMYWIDSPSFAGGYALTWLFLPKKEQRGNFSYYKIIEDLPQDFFRDTGLSVMCSEKGFLLFPSTDAPMDNEKFEFIKIDCSAGVYDAAIGFYETPDTSIRIIKIQRQE